MNIKIVAFKLNSYVRFEQYHADYTLLIPILLDVYAGLSRGSPNAVEAFEAPAPLIWLTEYEYS